MSERIATSRGLLALVPGVRWTAVLTCALAALLPGIVVPVAGADTRGAEAGAPGWEPKVCTSLDPQTKRAGSFGDPAGRAFDSCPAGSAIIAEGWLSSTATQAFQLTSLEGNCCFLPPDALTSSRHLFTGHCPEGSVVTGVQGFAAANQLLLPDEIPSYLFECTFINTTRYQLGPASLALRVTTTPYGFDRDGGRALLGLDPHLAVTWNQIPAALRYAIGRVGQHGHESLRCTGYPWGSMLVGRGMQTACGFSHRQLQYTGLPGDPVRGYPVPLFLECDAIADPYGENPRCIRVSPPAAEPGSAEHQSAAPAAAAPPSAPSS